MEHTSLPKCAEKMEAQDASDKVVPGNEQGNDEQPLNQKEHGKAHGNVMRLLGMCSELFQRATMSQSSAPNNASGMKEVEACNNAQPDSKTWHFIQEDGQDDMPKTLSIRQRRILRRRAQKHTSAQLTDPESQEASPVPMYSQNHTHMKGSSMSTRTTQTSPTPATANGQGAATIASRRASCRRTFFQSRLHHLSKRLQPLVRVTTGQVHPAFPQNMLSYHLLSDADLDSLADFYHQRTPSALSRMYPCPVSWADDLSTEDKRRKFGRFIGLGGLRSPTFTVPTVKQILEDARRAAIAEEETELLFARKGRI